MPASVFSVGLELPGNAAEHLPFRSDRSLFDADVVLFTPDITEYDHVEFYAGQPLITESESVALMRDIAHWKAELAAVANAGKAVFVFLQKPRSVYYHTGTSSTSGTGRSRVTTRHVQPVDSYACLPVALKGVTPRSGSEIAVMGDLGPLAAYWSEFGAASSYQVYFDATGVTPLLGTKNREKAVGAVVRTSARGAIVFLPPLTWDEKDLTYQRGESTYWRKEALSLGKRIVASLVEAGRALGKTDKRSPVPQWATDGAYTLPTEARTLTELAGIDDQLAKLAKKRKSLEERLGEERELYGLLYETGHPLEHSIRLALSLLGFEATAFRDGESEFDAVFTAAEGRFLGEAEGKDNKAVNIDKMSQLERNLQEDFAREEVTEFAKGVLFGNAYRLQPLSERAHFFTDKCVSAAKRLHAALVRTPDLFAAARYLSGTPDEAYARSCREALFQADGEVVTFPQPPSPGA